MDEFLKVMRKSGLVEEPRLQACLDKLSDSTPMPPGVLAERMREEGLLTAFQAAQLLAGKHKGFFLGQYRVLEPLGAGGMGVVYLCEHTVMQRRVAVKVLPSEQVGSQSLRERFMREARAAAALDHPNIVQAYTIETHGKLHFLVMEYVDGQTLQQIVKQQGPLDPARAAGYARQAALGLEHIGDKGLIHRDIKPGNLLLDKKGVVKILDMGLARFSEGPGDNLTRRLEGNAVLGTADYIAPEQAMDSHEADIRADIYSLGATLYFLLTGQPPFAEGTATQKLIRIQTCNPRPIREVRPEVSEGLAQVIAHMMARDPDVRYQSPGEVAAALEPFCAPGGEMSSARLPRPVPKPSPSTISKPAPTSAVRSSRVLLKREETADRPTIASNQPKVRARSRRDLPVWLLYCIGAGVAAVLLGVGSLVLVLMMSTSTSKPVTPSQPQASTLPDEPVIRFAPPQPAPPPAQPSVRPARDFRGHDSGVERVAVSPNGRRALSTSNDSTVRLWDLETGRELRILYHASATHGITFSADGRRALSGSSDQTIRLWDLDSDQELQRFTGHDGTIWGVCFSPDGLSIASAGSDRTVRLWDVKTGKEVKRFEGHTADVMGLAFSPDGKQIVSASADRTVRLWNVETGKEVRALAGHTSMVIMAAFLPDGRRVLSCAHDGTLRLWNAETGEVLRVLEGHKSAVLSLAVAPEGKRVVSGSNDGELLLWDLESTAAPQLVGRHNGRITAAAFAPDGSRAVTGGDDKVVRLWCLPAVTLGTRAGLVGHWKFDEKEGENAVDSSGKDHHGKRVGKPVPTAGKFGAALSLDGKSDHVSTSFTQQLDSWTIAVWVQAAEAPRAEQATGPMQRDKNFQINWDHGEERSRGAAQLYVNGEWRPASFGPLEGKRWYHLTATFDGAKLRTYKDGALVTTTEVNGVAEHEQVPLVLGRNAVRPWHFAGAIGDVRVYERPLSDRDVADLFAGR
jgi:WD40 repeat protein/tRNA A-37 threonylcarbamoyl transferase component Bud32